MFRNVTAVTIRSLPARTYLSYSIDITVLQNSGGSFVRLRLFLLRIDWSRQSLRSITELPCDQRSFLRLITKKVDIIDGTTQVEGTVQKTQVNFFFAVLFSSHQQSSNCSTFATPRVSGEFNTAKMNNSWLQRLMSGSGSLLPQLFPENGSHKQRTPQEVDSFLASSMAQLNVNQR